MNRNYPVTLTLSLCLMLAAFAIPATAADLANLQPGPSALQWQPTASAAGWVLTVSGPDGFYHREQFDGAPALGLFDSEGQFLADGLYTYELQALPQISSQLRQDLDAAANDLAWREYLAARMDSSDLVQSGNFRIYQGALVQGDQEELSAPDLGGAVPTGDFAVGQAVPEGGLDHTQVINMDLLVDGSLCVGFDCGSSQNFGFDTVRLRENNLRIHFDDTSNSGSFPNTDWRLVANDTNNGGANRFSIEDASAGRTPFTIEGGSIANALYVSDEGDVGVGTSTPVVEVHAVDGNTPALRLEQNGSSGFQAQTWDLAGNETNFFLRDVTNGSKLPFRVRPNSPEDSIDIRTDEVRMHSNVMVVESSGNVGMGTQTPTAEGLHIVRSDAQAAARDMLIMEANGPGGMLFLDTANSQGWSFIQTSGGAFRISDTTGNGSADGNTEFNLNNAGDLEISGTLTTGGMTCGGGCDAVFSPAYEMPSIEEHAEQMWANSYLPGVGPTVPNAPVNLPEKTGGILNELEKAHIYIQQLNTKIKTKDTRIASLEERLERLEALIDGGE